ncbi:MAG: 3-dehydroquinate synthase [Planctomycetota bacterium]|nr:3-dehydroquinate synthase [Planctomycetota bacterium]
MTEISQDGRSWPHREDCRIRTGPIAEVLDEELLGSIPTSQLLLRDSGVDAAALDPLRSILARRAALIERVVPGGAACKSPESWQQILQIFAEVGLDRGGLVVVAGGGSVGDACAFAASVWHRGVPWIAIPTTLLAMVDAHIGGKTAIHLGGIKNRIGSFHLPRAVVSDRAMLESLPLSERAMGWAELIKAAWIGDPQLLESLEQSSDSIPVDLIPRSEHLAQAVAVKVAIVDQDPFEKGPRERLNFGHTLGHALEMLSSPTMPHGEAVARGMVFAARLAEQIGEASDGTAVRLATLLQRASLPTDCSGIGLESLLETLQGDKKTRAGQLRWVIPRRPGEMVVRPVAIEVVERVLRFPPLEAIVNPLT